MRFRRDSQLLWRHNSQLLLGGDFETQLSVIIETRSWFMLRHDSQFQARRSRWMFSDVDVSATLDTCMVKIELEIRIAYLNH